MEAKPRIWRVDYTHVCGYNAPHSLIETNEERECKAEAEAIKQAKENSRLSEFDNWSLTVTKLDRRKLNGKWYSEEEYQKRKGKF